MFELIIIESVLFIYLDKKIYGSKITPVSVLTIPFIIVLTITTLYSEKMGMVPLYDPCLIFWNIGLISFWIPSLIFALLFRKNINLKKHPNYNPNNLKHFDLFFKTLGTIVAFICLIGLFKGYLKYKSLSFGDELAGGLIAHAAVLLRIFIVYILIFKKLAKGNYLYKFIFLVGITYSLIYTVKSWLIIPLVAGILGNIIVNKKKFKVYYFIVVPIFAFIVFFLTYSISLNNNAPLDFIFRHIFFYINSGILSLSEYYKNNGEIGISIEFLFQPMYNILYKLSGINVNSVVSDIANNIGVKSLSNVKTFFGTIFIYGGFIGGSFVSFIWGSISYLFLNLSRLNEQPFFIVYYFLLIAALAMGWFDIYFNNLGYYEFLMWIVILSFSYSLSLKIKIKPIQIPPIRS